MRSESFTGEEGLERLTDLVHDEPFDLSGIVWDTDPSTVTIRTQGLNHSRARTRGSGLCVRTFVPRQLIRVVFEHVTRLETLDRAEIEQYTFDRIQIDTARSAIRILANENLEVILTTRRGSASVRVELGSVIRVESYRGRART